MAQGLSVTVIIDDAEVVVPILPLGLVAMERKWGGEPPGLEGSLYAAWYGIKVRDDVPGEFEDWLATLDGIVDTSGAQSENPTTAP